MTPSAAVTVAQAARQAVADYIVRVPQALPAELCQALLAEYRDSSEWAQTRVDTRGVQREVRNADAIRLTDPAVLGRNPTVRRKLDAALGLHTGRMIRHYHACFPRCRVVRDSGFELLRYQPGGFYRQHTDSYAQVPRELACSYLLNDDFEGGSFAFFDGTWPVPMRAGDALLFPANFMFPHEIQPVTQGARYSIVTWFI